MNNPYEYEIDPNGTTTPNKVLALVGGDRAVLELGTAAGVMTREFQRRGCRVTGVEYVAEMAAVAGQWCERLVVGDLEQLDFDAEFRQQTFDVVVAADVLEHLRAPEHVLARLRAHLAGSPGLVVSVPNIAYAGLVGALSLGRFDYRDKGLLDNTHMRFFTRSSLEWMLLSTGWIPVCWDAHRVPVEQSEFASDWSALDPAQRRSLLAQPDGDVYQFIVRAAPASDAGLAVRYDAQLDTLKAELADSRAAHQSSLDERAGEHADLLEHRKAFAEAKSIIETQQRQLEAQAQVLAETKDHIPVPGWMDYADRRAWSRLARYFSRLAQRATK